MTVDYNMAFDERFVFEDTLMGSQGSEMDDIIYNEHKVRYEFASQYVVGKKVLDIASGSGYGTSMLARAGAEEVTGIDIDREAVEEAEKKYIQNNLKYMHGSAYHIPFSDSSVDLLVSFETIEHLKDYKKFLSEIRRVLKENGLLIISTPNKEIYQEKNPYHLKEFELGEFESLLKEYFPVCKILKQVNSVASTILSAEGNKANFSANNISAPQYFVALCSANKIEMPDKNYVNSNPMALERLRNNPVLKVSDRIYRVFGKLFGK